MKKIEDLNYYELLEVSTTASSQEIHKAYERIRRVYEPNSVALYSLFTPEETDAIQQRIEDAYRTLVYEDNRRRYDALLRERNELPELPPLPAQQRYQSPAYPPAYAAPAVNRPSERTEPLQNAAPSQQMQEAVAPMSQLISEFTGPTIKLLREQKGLTLRNVADTTKLGTRYLEFLENEVFAKLPARAYIRGFLMLYAKVLGCDPMRMSNDYLKRYDLAINSLKK